MYGGCKSSGGKVPILSGRGGGRNCKAEMQYSLLCPPLFFLEVGRKKGDVTASEYGI